MNFWFLLLTLLFVTVSAQETNEIQFSLDEFTLSKCIRDYFKNIRNLKKIEIKKFIVIVDAVSKEFGGSTKVRESINDEIWIVIQQLYIDETIPFYESHVARRQIEEAFEKALIYCSDDEDDDDVDDGRDNVSLPAFDGEPPELARILDYILVDWPFNLYYMIRSRNGRSLLRRYANSAQVMLESMLALSSNHEVIRLLLLTLWMRRAEMYFDGRNIHFLYIRHRYTTDNMAPFTNTRDVNLLSVRSTLNFRDRNPSVPRSYLDRILSIHVADRNESDAEYDIYSEYERNGMSRAEYYFETHIDQFYRVLFFIQELELRGITTDADDIYNDHLPYDIIPEAIQAIVHNDTVYRDYLLNRRRNELSFRDDNCGITQSLASTARVREEELILFFRMRMRSIVHSTTTTSTTTTTRTTSSTDKNPPSDKENVCVNDEVTSFTKWHETFPTKCCEHHHGKNWDSSFLGSCLHQRYNYNVTSSRDNVFIICHMLHQQRRIENKEKYYGFITDSDDPIIFSKRKIRKDRIIFMNKPSSYINILNDVLDVS